jgi:hypothetical protein
MSGRANLTDPAEPSHLFHVSERSGIIRFVPRPASRAIQDLDHPVVWAVDESHLCNYLLPRDCPRVTFRAGPGTTAGDVVRLMRSDSVHHVVAVEAGWLSSIRAARLSLYRFDTSGFEIQDNVAGYYVSRETVIPTEEVIITDLIEAICSRGVELRVLDSLWELRELVIGSTLEYSIIRMRNAAPHEGLVDFHALP